MLLMRRALIAIVFLAVAGGGVVEWMSSASPAAAQRTFSYTVAGTDTHSLDPHVQPMFMPGGGVALVRDSADIPFTYTYLEVGLDLPVGAKVTSFAVTYSACTQAKPTFVFGSYEPTTGDTEQDATLTGALACSLKTTTKSGSPITTTVAGRRYALDITPSILELYPANEDGVFYGATIKYTCSSPCVP